MKCAETTSNLEEPFKHLMKEIKEVTDSSLLSLF